MTEKGLSGRCVTGPPRLRAGCTGHVAEVTTMPKNERLIFDIMSTPPVGTVSVISKNT